MKALPLQVVLLLGVIVVIVFEFLLADRWHQDAEALRIQFRDGTPHERIRASFVQANRGAEPTVSAAQLQRLLYAPDPLLRDWAMSTTVVRHTGRLTQREYLERSKDEVAVARASFLLEQQNRKGRRQMTRADLEAFLAACQGELLTEAEEEP